MSESKQQTSRQTAFEALLDALDQPARRFIRRLIGYHMAEDDIVQDAFLALYLNMERLTAEHVRPFLFRVIRNRSYDILRRQGRYDTVSYDDALDHTLHAPILSHDEATHWVMLESEVQVAIDRLPEVQRQAMILYAVEDLSYAEVAQAMDVSIGTVKSRIHHARKLLKRLMRPETLHALGLSTTDSPSDNID